MNVCVSIPSNVRHFGAKEDANSDGLILDMQVRLSADKQVQEVK